MFARWKLWNYISWVCVHIRTSEFGLINWMMCDVFAFLIMGELIFQLQNKTHALLIISTAEKW